MVSKFGSFTTQAAGAAEDTVAAGETLYGVILYGDGGAEVTCEIKEGSGGTTRFILALADLDGTRIERSKVVMFPVGVKFTGTINVNVTGTNGIAYILHGK